MKTNHPYKTTSVQNTIIANINRNTRLMSLIISIKVKPSATFTHMAVAVAIIIDAITADIKRDIDNNIFLIIVLQNLCFDNG